MNKILKTLLCYSIFIVVSIPILKVFASLTVSLFKGTCLGAVFF